jgi:leucyl-tRNA synthetase
LPEIDDYLPRDDGKSPLAKAEAWVHVLCPQCGGEALRDTDTLDTFVDSSWYFLRYLDSHNDREFAAKEKLTAWMPVSFYSGGAEHTTMHLLYSRFWHKVLFDLGLVNEPEPYTRRMNRGLILGPDGQKMSKSKGNVIDPDKEVENFGADSVRMYLAFIGPYNEVGAYPWNPDGIVGVRRFLEKVWRIKDKVGGENADSILLNQTIKKVGDEIKSMKMNTGVSALMILVNAFDKREQVSKKEYETLLKLLAPFAPHMAEELWRAIGNEGSIHTSSWPSYDEAKLVADTVTMVVQVDGKVRSKFTASSSIGEAEALEKARSLPEVAKWVGDKVPVKTVFVPGKLVNFVLS